MDRSGILPWTNRQLVWPVLARTECELLKQARCWKTSLAVLLYGKTSSGSRTSTFFTITVASKGRHATREFLFTRLIICGECGPAVTAEIKKGKHVYYHCTGYGKVHKIVYVTKAEPDRQFASIVRAVVLPSEWYGRIKEELERESRGQKEREDRQRTLLTRQRELLLGDMRKTYEDHLRGKLTTEFLRTVHEDQQQSLDAITFQLSSLAAAAAGQFDLARKAIELSHQAESLYLSANRLQKR